MKHEEWRLWVSAYCDGEVTPEERTRVEAHLAECAECARALETYRRLGRAVRALPRGTPSRTMWLRVQEGLARPARPLWWRFLPAVSAVAVLIVAVVVGLLLRPAPSGPAVLQVMEEQGMAEATSPALRAPSITLAPPPAATEDDFALTPGPPPCPGFPLALELVALSARSEAELPSPRLSGLLYDEAGRPLAGVTLVVSGTAGWQGSTTTASDGTFSLPLPSAGTYQVVLALTPVAKDAGAFEEGKRFYRLTLPNGFACQTWREETLPTFTVGPQQEISLTLRVRP